MNKGTAVSPQQYKISTKSSTNTRYSDIAIGIGYGKKGDAHPITSSKYPGPGEYNLPSIFDKNRKYKYALN
jgi:hypothetical protein